MGMNEIRERLTDEESKFLFDKKIESIVLKDEDIYLEAVFACEKEWRCEEIELLRSEENKDKKIIIFGAGKRGRATYFLLKQMGMAERVVAVADNNVRLKGKMLCDVPIIAPRSMPHYTDALILISSVNYGGELYQQVMRMYDIPSENIIYPRAGAPCGKNGWQYFDVFEPSKDEVFIDAGFSYGDTSGDFARWSGNTYKKIFAFEPLDDSEYRCRKAIEEYQLRDVTFCNKGTWSCDAELHFQENGSASSICEEGTCVIKTTSIDNVLAGERATFIKMDVEGAELESLKGAQETIRKYRPKLAISLYHKPEDILEIPEYILELNPAYRFTIRHYHADMTEMVLYAE